MLTHSLCADKSSCVRPAGERAREHADKKNIQEGGHLDLRKPIVLRSEPALGEVTKQVRATAPWVPGHLGKRNLDRFLTFKSWLRK